MIPKAITQITGRSFLCSWSGGKDSCLALYHAIHQGGIPQCRLSGRIDADVKAHNPVRRFASGETPDGAAWCVKASTGTTAIRMN